MAKIRDVAALAGVSPSTVSIVFSGSGPVSEQTRRKVLAAAKKLGYQPDHFAGALRTGRNRSIGFCVSHTTNPTVAAIIQGASLHAHQAGYALLVSAMADDPDLERAHLEVMTRQRVAAVITYATTDDPSPYLRVQHAGIPVIFIGSRPAGITADVLMADYRQGAYLATRHLLETGRRRIGLLIAGAATRMASTARVEGYRAAYADAGLAADEQLIQTCPSKGDTTFAATDDLLSRGADAILASSTIVTVGVLSHLMERGLRVPADVAFVATGAIEWAFLASPALTNIEFDGERIGRRAVDLALERMGHGFASLPPREVLVPVRLAIRESSLGADVGYLSPTVR
ncbi:MAG: LacI family DNA-binding transcriptional regulator [Dehalococcoidales bacterium]|nr:LacI family DNA-binding transcriptional regulator [Dehalococcoidales bacterium]